MNNKFRDWILKTYKRPIYEYEHHGYFTIEDMEEAWEEGANAITKFIEKDIDKDIALLNFMKYCDILNKENLESMKEK